MSQQSAPICITFRKSPGTPHPIPLFDGNPILTPGYRYAISDVLRILELLEIGYQNLDWIVRNKYTLRLQKENTDLMNASREMLARGKSKELTSFMDMHVRPMEVKIPVFEHVVDVLQSHPLRYNPGSVKKYLDVDIPADKVTQSSPDYSSVLEYVYDNNPIAANIEIPLSGSRSVDEQIALQFLEKKKARVPTREEMNREFVLHHAWPILKDNGELWFIGQIVQKDFHGLTTMSSLKGMIEPLPDLPRQDRDLWDLALEGIEQWEGPSDGFDPEISRLLFGHVGPVKGYTEFYPGVFYKQ